MNVVSVVPRASSAGSVFRISDNGTDFAYMTGGVL
jgi:hypothetical protein